ncbi:MAG: hypothetical protein EPN88_16060 [Bacteroidetes bacterium]|nr:MAG: hypothetical protein EPN88_16060 [Bacteroidota bacterium]
MFRILSFSIWFLFHPVHVTLTSIDYIPEMGVFKVFVRMYFDDFMRDYKLTGGDIQSKDFSDKTTSSKDVMERYIDEKIKIKVNEKRLSGKLQDLDIVDNEISMNLEYKTGKKPKIITVKNLIMTDLYSDQSNMIIVKVNEFDEGVKLTTDLTEKTFKIN